MGVQWMAAGSSVHRESGSPGFARVTAVLVVVVGMTGALGRGDEPAEPSQGWQAALVEAQMTLAAADANEATVATAAEEFSIRSEREFPVCWDWCLQDAGPDFAPWLSAATLPTVTQKATANVLAELGGAGRELQREFDRLVNEPLSGDSAHWLSLYLRAAERRREARLQSLRQKYPHWIFTKHHTLGGSHYAYTEGQSDAQHERQFVPDAALCRLDLDEGRARVHTLLEDRDGVIRDPDVSWDGRRVLFAWKKSDREDDYHLYEMAVADGSVKQLTDGLGFADYEGVYLPNDDILFNSTRCVQTVDCWWTEVSNLYTCDRDGRRLRRVTFDQVHDNFPTVMPDGRIVYTRWEYQDRGQLFVQSLFQMNPDGTSQTEFYGNNSWFPTSLLHARGIPGTQKIVATFSGHHTMQVGKLGIVDPALGRQENSGARLIAPSRETSADRVDYYGQDGDLHQYPYPLSETEFVSACAPLGWSRSPALFKVYWIAADGRRELLAADPSVSCNQPVPLAARSRPLVRPSLVDDNMTSGTCYLQDIYVGPGLAGIARGTIKKLRVIGLEYRAAGMGWNYNAGPAGDALVCTPVAIGNGSWDVKTVLGEAAVYADGSAFFWAPVRTPLYFQAIDARGHAVQTMRSWTTLQPGESVSCVGCHEAKNSTPIAAAPSQATKTGPQDLTPFHGAPRGFSYAREIQPVLNRHCIRCHDDSTTRPLPGQAFSPSSGNQRSFSLLDKPVLEALAKTRWSESYLALTQVTTRTLEGHEYLAGTIDGLVNWVGAQSVPDLLPPCVAGAARSRLLSLLTKGHYDVKLAPQEMEKLACWIDLQVPFCGDYEEAREWTRAEQRTYRKFLAKRRRMEAMEREGLIAGVSLAAQESQAPSSPAESNAFLSPAALAVNGSGSELYVAAATGRQILVVDRQSSKVIRRILLPDSPSGLALASNRKTLYVTAGAPEGTLLLVDPDTGEIRSRIPAGHSPTAPVLSEDGKTLLVCDRFRARLLAIDLTSRKVRGELPIGREPVAAARTPDGRLVLVASLLPAGSATESTVAAEIVAVKADDLTVAGRIPLLNGSTSARGIAVASDGRYAYVVHTLAHYQLPTTQVDRGWMNTSALSVIDVAELRRINTVLLDEVDRGTANPWDVACSRDGRWLCVSHSGTHEVSVIDRRGLHRKLDAVDAGRLTSPSLTGPQDVPSDMSFLVELRRRVRLPGNGPRGVAIAGDTLYVGEYFSDSLATVELTAEAKCKVVSIPLGPAPVPDDVRRGEMLFHDAELCFQHWQSCASCHPDARADGLNWDLLNDGLGSPRNTKSLLLSHVTPPSMSLGVRETAEGAVRAGLRHIQFVVRPETDARAIDAYLKSLAPLSSPHRAGTDEVAKAQGGKLVFEKAGCAGCHIAPLYTSLKAYDVGTGLARETGASFDTPTLVELWRTAPYLHDGRAATLREVLTKFNSDDRHGETSQLSEAQIKDLEAYLLSL